MLKFYQMGTISKRTCIFACWNIEKRFRNLNVLYYTATVLYLHANQGVTSITFCFWMENRKGLLISTLFAFNAKKGTVCIIIAKINFQDLPEADEDGETREQRNVILFERERWKTFFKRGKYCKIIALISTAEGNIWGNPNKPVASAIWRQFIAIYRENRGSIWDIMSVSFFSGEHCFSETKGEPSLLYW